MVTAIVVGVIAFVVGVVIGVRSAASVDASIASIKSAEQRAQATLTQIVEHKRS